MCAMCLPLVAHCLDYTGPILDHLCTCTYSLPPVHFSKQMNNEKEGASTLYVQRHVVDGVRKNAVVKSLGGGSGSLPNLRWKETLQL